MKLNPKIEQALKEVKNGEYTTYTIEEIMSMKINRKLNELTDEEVLKVCKVLNGERVKEATIERQPALITVKYFDDDIEAKTEISIATSYRHRISDIDLITETVFYFDRDQAITDEIDIEYYNRSIQENHPESFNMRRLLERIIARKENNYYYEPSVFQVSQGKLLEIIKYLQSINIEL